MTSAASCRRLVRGPSAGSAANSSGSRPSRCRTNRSGWKKPEGMSIRPREPVTDAVTGVPPTIEQCSEASAPFSQDSTAPVWRSTPSGDSTAFAAIPSGSPSRSCANDTGYTPRSSSAPPPSAGSRSRCAAGKGPASPKSACTVRTSPIAPSSTSAFSRRTSGLQYIHIASIRKRSCSRASVTSSSASRRFSVNGFSHSTFRPAVRHSPAAARCAVCGVATYTTSTSGSAASDSQSPYARSTPNRSANASADSRRREATATMSASGRSTRSAANAAAIPPVARIPHRTLSPAIPPSLICASTVCTS